MTTTTLNPKVIILNELYQRSLSIPDYQRPYKWTEKNVRTLFDVTEHFVDVPVNLKYTIGLPLPVNMFVAAGPYAQFKVAGSDVAAMEKELSADIKDKKFQAGVNVGVGVEAFKLLQVGLNYRIKLTDDYSANTPEWTDALSNRKSGFWSVTASVYF